MLSSSQGQGIFEDLKASRQVRRQNSVTGGGGGGGAEMNFFLKLGSEDKKKGLHPKLHSVDTGHLPAFGGLPTNSGLKTKKKKEKEQKKKKVFGTKS